MMPKVWAGSLHFSKIFSSYTLAWIESRGTSPGTGRKWHHKGSKHSNNNSLSYAYDMFCSCDILLHLNQSMWNQCLAANEENMSQADCLYSERFYIFLIAINKWLWFKTNYCSKSHCFQAINSQKHTFIFSSFKHVCVPVRDYYSFVYRFILSQERYSSLSHLTPTLNENKERVCV